MLGFAISYISAYILAFLAYRHEVIGEFLYPFVSILKATPVAAVVVIISIIAGSNMLSFYVTFMIAFPIVYLSVLEALKDLDVKLIEMAKVFRISWYNRYRCIYVPGIKSGILSSLKSGIGLSFKSGVAAEVICQATNTIGDGIYSSKIYLDTSGVLAWTVAVILLSFVVERLISGLVTHLYGLKPAKNYEKKNEVSLSEIQALNCMNKTDIIFDNWTKSYGDNKVINNFSLTVKSGEVSFFSGDSGSGKTTILKSIAGLDDEYVPYNKGNNAKVSMLFQEDRLCDEKTVKDNLHIVNEKIEDAAIIDILGVAGLGNNLYSYCNELSGGMKRRVSLIRALISQSDIVILDEPFAGLDAGNIKTMISLINRLKGDRTLIVAGHDRKYAEELNARVIDTWKC